MKEYRAIYKCRLCGKIFANGKKRTENKSLNKIVNLSTVSPLFPHDKGYIPHGCKDGSIGLAEFLGFRKVDE